LLIDDLEKEIHYNVVEKENFISFSENAFERDIKSQLDNFRKAIENLLSENNIQGQNNLSCNDNVVISTAPDKEICENCGHTKDKHYNYNTDDFRDCYYQNEYNESCLCKQFVPKKAEGGK
jgi:hypothetical protein